MRKKQLFALSCLALGVFSLEVTGVIVASNSSLIINRAVEAGPSITLDSSNLLSDGSPISGLTTISNASYGDFIINIVGISYDSMTELFTVAENGTGYIFVNTPSKLVNGAGGTGYTKGSSASGTNIAFRGYNDIVTKPYVSYKGIIDASSTTPAAFPSDATFPYISFGTNDTGADKTATFSSLTFYWSCA